MKSRFFTLFCLLLITQSSWSQLSTQVLPSNGESVGFMALGPLSNTSYSSQKLGMHFSACDLQIPSGSNVVSLTYFVASNAGLINDNIVVGLRNSNSCGLSSWETWSNVQSTSTFASCTLFPVGANAYKIVLNHDNFYYSGGGLDVFTYYTGVQNTGMVNGYLSPGNTVTWLNNLTNDANETKRAAPLVTYLPNLTSPTVSNVQVVTCNQGTTFCANESFCLSIKSTNAAIASLGDDTFWSYQWQKSNNNLTWVDISGATANTYSGSLSVSTYYRCKVTTDNAVVFYANSIQLQAVSSSNYFACYPSPTPPDDLSGGRITGVEMRRSGFGLLQSTSNTAGDGICDANDDGSYTILSRNNESQTFTQLSAATIFDPDVIFSDFASGLVQQNIMPVVAAGDVLEFRVKMDRCAKPMLFNHKVAVEFDWNNDQVFDSTQYMNIFNSTITLTYPGNDPESAVFTQDLQNVEYVKYVTVPCDLACDAITKFRVRLKKVPTGWGETEDYSVKALCGIPVITSTATAFCPGGSVTLTAPTGSVHQWAKNGVDLVGENSSSIVVTSPGDYTVYVVPPFSSCGKWSDPLTIVQHPSPSVAFTTPITMNCVTNALGANIGEVAEVNCTYAWSPSGTLNSSTASNPLATPLASTLYKVVKTNTLTGCKDSTEIAVDVDFTTPVVFAGMDQTVCGGSSVTLSGTSVTPGLVYTWLPAVGNGVPFVPASTQTYVVTGTAANGCVGSDAVVVNVVTPTTYYQDGDGDGFGNGSLPLVQCSLPVGYVVNNLDCNDAVALVNPAAVEVCANLMDDNCNGLTDEGCGGGGGGGGGVLGDPYTNPFLPTGIIQFGYNSFNSWVNMSTMSDSPETASSGNDCWFRFTAAHNAFRVGVQGDPAVADDYEILIFPYSGSPMGVPSVVSSDAVTLASPGASVTEPGNEVLLTDDLVVGTTYMVCVRSKAANGTIRVSLAYLKGSSTDINAYTAGTQAYSTSCGIFKATFCYGGSSYQVHRWDGPTGGAPNYSYVIPPTASNKTVCQVGKILPANTGSLPVVYHCRIDVTYNYQDAFGNPFTLIGVGNSYNPVTMNPELTALTVRTADQYPTIKNVTNGAIFASRSICGTSKYHYEFRTATGPPLFTSAGLPVTLFGPVNAQRQLMLNTVPSIVNGGFYNVRVQSQHLDGFSFSGWGTAGHVKTLGAAGLTEGVPSDWIVDDLSSMPRLFLYPNPSSGGNAQLVFNQWEGVIEVNVLDAEGRRVHRSVVSTLNTEWSVFDLSASLSPGLYVVDCSNGMDHEVIRWLVD